jgi:lipooligosaccharide transport system ATP-binding protein
MARLARCTVVSGASSLVHARGLDKRFGDLVAVDGVDFDVERGEAFGFLGPNGAGKTSTRALRSS